MGAYCIFCDSTQRSKEHIFPSSFGGQLENSKIYCETHNSALGKYVEFLDSQIGALNNIFGIRPDRGDSKSIKLEDPITGDIFLRNVDGEIALSILDNINEKELLTGKPYEIITSSHQDITYLKKHLNKKHSVDIKILEKGEPTKEVFKNQLRLEITFGGLDFFKSILYLSITFIAHYSRETIEYIDIKSIKKILLNNDEFDIDNMVSLEKLPPFLKDDENSIMHSFAFIKNNGFIYSIFSYFNTVTYVIKIGECKNDFNNFVIYIYPLVRTKNPNDSMVKESLPEDVLVNFSPSLHKENIKKNLQGDANSPIKLLEKKLSIFENNRQNKMLIDGLKKQKTSEDMKLFWLNNKQHIFNSIKFLSKEEPGSNNPIEIAVKYLKILLEINGKAHFNNIISSISNQRENLNFQNQLRLIDLDYFMSDVCENLSDYYTANIVNDDEVVFDTICKEILKQAIANLKKLNELFKFLY
ncbi:HNH endonuclease [Glaesserella sp.]|uniref:HNH endonuclease n=1 Tax=Glaesserella sp. TaxID=2094731 RepID=UPI0035A1CCD6